MRSRPAVRPSATRTTYSLLLFNRVSESLTLRPAPRISTTVPDRARLLPLCPLLPPLFPQYCDPQVVNEVVLPLIVMSNTVLLCISTLRESTNHYSKMFALRRPDGTPVFKNIQISLVCEKCMLTDRPQDCTHKNSEMPRWLSSTNLETIKTLLADDTVRLFPGSLPSARPSFQRSALLCLASFRRRNNHVPRTKALLLRESMGISAESTTRAFKESSIVAFASRPRSNPVRISHIFVAVDPSGGGQSAFAVASTAITLSGDVMVRMRFAARLSRCSAGKCRPTWHTTARSRRKSLAFVGKASACREARR